MQKTVIAIVSYNAKRYMQECIQSIREKVTPGTYLISVVDNASTDGIADWLSQQPDILLIQNDVNIGFGPACNQAVRATKGTEFEDADVFFLNNDTVITSTALPRMIDTLYSADDIGAVGAMGNYAGNRQQIDVEFPSTEDYIRFGEGIQIPEADRRLEKVRLNGFAMLVRRNVWDAVGGFDEDFAPGYYEDDALSIDILKLGYRLMLSRDSFIYHVGSASFVKTGTNRLSFEHHELFIQKYDFDILDYVYPCGAVMSQIPFGRSDSFNVLQLGSGLGAELKAIRSLYPNSDVIGIENNNVLYNISKKTETIFHDVTDMNFVCDDNTFDLLIVDENYLETLTDNDRQLIATKCRPGAVEISRLHEYDTFPFDNVRLVIWDDHDYNATVANLWANWGIMSSVYKYDNFKARVRAYGIKNESILLLSSDPGFRGNAFFMIPNMLNAAPTIIPYLTAHYGRLRATDPGHINAARLNIFEEKYNISKSFDSYDSFLEDSGITVTIVKNCYDNIDRILEILSEHSLTDYIKAAYDRPHLIRLLSNDWNDCACITARDKYTDYGIIGFYCFNQREQKFYAFAFSWFVTGMGIEQYVYNSIGSPDIIAVGPVCTTLQKDISVPWIKQIEPNASDVISDKQHNIRILLKGSSDIHSIEDYLVGGEITSEYDNMALLCKEAPSAQVRPVLPTKLYSVSYHIIIYSLLQYSYTSWESDSDGMLAELFNTLDSLCCNTPGAPTIILLLGSEIPFEGGTEDDKKLAELHSELSQIIYDFAADNPAVKAINVTDFITDQSDFDNSVNRFGVRVYSDIVARIVEHINEKVDALLGQ